jgi:hypothetical protein
MFSLQASIRTDARARLGNVSGRESRKIQRRAMTGWKSLALVATAALTIGIVPASLSFASGSESAEAGPDRQALVSAKPKSGRYQGKVGSFARIIMKTTPKKIKRLDAGVQASCQRASDGYITGIELVAMKTTKTLKVKRKGKFKGEGQDKKTGVAWKVKGRFVSRKKAKGTFEASLFRPVFNPYVSFDSELCSGSGKWTAKLKR